MKVCIVDYGAGNVQSLDFALNRLGVSGILTSEKEIIMDSDKVIFPGVGEASTAMRKLKSTGLDKVIPNLKQPFLGICLGMQLLSEKSDERGSNCGLSLIPGEICKIPDLDGYRLPHVGWNDVKVKNSAPLFTNIADSSSFYFVHSYRFMCDSEYVAGTAEYGNSINAVVQNNHIFGVQFHPEKSQKKGLRLINNFINYVKISNGGP